MTTEPNSPPIETATGGGLQRRTVVSAAAWAAPAIVMTAASPAAAASTTVMIVIESQNPATVAPGADVEVYGTVVVPKGGARPYDVNIDLQGSPFASAPLQVPIGPGGIFGFRLNGIASDGKEHTAEIVLTCEGGGYTTHPVRVLAGSLAQGSIDLTFTPGLIPQGEQRDATGKVIAPEGAARPTSVTVTSSATDVATVPASVPVGSDGTFTIPVTAVAASGTATITVSQNGYTSATFTTLVNAPKPKVGTIDITSTPGSIPQLEEKTATGRVNPPDGTARPSTVTVTSSATNIASVPATVPVKSDGTFSIPVTAVAGSGTATITVSATGYTSATFDARATAGTGIIRGFDLPEILGAIGFEFRSTNGKEFAVQAPPPPREPIPSDDGFEEMWISNLGGGLTYYLEATTGSWIRGKTPDLYWTRSDEWGSSIRPMVGGRTLNGPVPARRWNFRFENTTGKPMTITVKINYHGKTTEWYFMPETTITI